MLFAGIVMRADWPMPCIGGPARMIAIGVALGPRVREVVVNVAVEHLVPVTGAWEADCVAMVVAGLFAQAHDDDHITAYAGQPPVIGENAVEVVVLVNVHGFRP